MRVGYGKIGRAMPLQQGSWGFVGGDDEPPNLLLDLARRNPDVEFVLVGRNSGEDPAEIGWPSNITNPWTTLWPKIRGEMKTLGLKSPLQTEKLGELIAIFDDHTFDLFDDLDHLITWWGQHGTSNMPIPMTKTPGDWSPASLTSPQDSFVHYCSYYARGVNYWRRKDPIGREEINLIADARNYIKLRDYKWPHRHPILGQYKYSRMTKHERFGDTRNPEDAGFPDATWCAPGVWKSKQDYVYSRLEICGIMPWHIDSTYDETWEGRGKFGLFINEARSYVKHNRLDALTDYVLPLDPDWVHGSWSKDSALVLKEKYDRVIEPAPWEVYYPLIRSVRSTFTTPSSGSGWATTKPWQAFAVGTVCFFHPKYDTQSNILNDAPPEMKEWLRVKDPEDLRKRVEYLNSDAGRDAWMWLVRAQRAHYDKAVEEAKHLTMIEERMRA